MQDGHNVSWLQICFELPVSDIVSTCSANMTDVR